MSAPPLWTLNTARAGGDNAFTHKFSRIMEFKKIYSMHAFKHWTLLIVQNFDNFLKVVIGFYFYCWWLSLIFSNPLSIYILIMFPSQMQKATSIVCCKHFYLSMAYSETSLSSSSVPWSGVTIDVVTATEWEVRRFFIGANVFRPCPVWPSEIVFNIFWH